MEFLTIQQEVASRLRLDLTVSEQVTLVKRWINLSQQEIWGLHDWPWALEREVVSLTNSTTAFTYPLKYIDVKAKIE